MLKVLPMVTRRLDTEERRSIISGSVYVWEERGPSPESTGVRLHRSLSVEPCAHITPQLGIERWTDGKR